MSHSSNDNSQGGAFYEDRRSFPRVPLDAPHFVTLQRNGGKADVMLVDLSRGGAQLALAPSENNLPYWLGEEALLLGLPPNIDKDGLGYRCVVSWLRPERCGVRFQPPLCMEEEELLAALQCL